MLHPVVVLVVFAVIALAELPDKSLFAALILGTRYRPAVVFVGVAAAFAVHVAISVAAGGVLTLAPHRVVQAVVTALFALGAAILLLGREQTEETKGEEEANAVGGGRSVVRVAATSFLVVFVGEWGDITQIATANYAARYHDPVSVGLGAVLGLWTVTALAVTAGRRLLAHVPVTLVRRIAGLVMLAFAVASGVAAL